MFSPLRPRVTERSARQSKKKSTFFCCCCCLFFFLREGVCNPQFQTVLGWPHTKKNRKFQFFKSLDVYQPISRSFQQHTHTKKKREKNRKKWPFNNVRLTADNGAPDRRLGSRRNSVNNSVQAGVGEGGASRRGPKDKIQSFETQKITRPIIRHLTALRSSTRRETLKIFCY